MKVVLYLRYSSDRQTEQSIEGQRRVCREYCDRNDYTIVGEYVDRATSAFKDVDKRVQFQKMIKDSAKKLFEAVVVYKFDRFARNRFDSAVYENKLEKNKVKLLSATEVISDGPEGVILKSVIVGMTEYYSLELSQKINRGLKESALKCQSTGGITPLGYKVVNKKYVINETTAPIVKEAFELYDNNTSINEICRIFNSKGYKTATGGKFNKNSFHRMLENDFYIGTYKYKDFIKKKGVPAIISDSLFERVQGKLKNQKTKQSRGKAKTNYLLSYKLICGKCGAKMFGDSGTSKSGKVYYYYTCDNKKKNGTCDSGRIRKDFIENIVFEQAIKLLTTETIDELATMAVNECRRIIEEDTLVPALEDELKATETKIENLLKFFEGGSDSKSVRDRIAKLEEDRSALEIRLETEKNNFIYLRKEQVVWWLNKFTKGNIEDENFRRNIFNLLVNSVTVQETKKGYRLIIAYNLNTSNTQTFECSTSDLSGGDEGIRTPVRKPFLKNFSERSFLSIFTKTNLKSKIKS